MFPLAVLRRFDTDTNKFLDELPINPTETRRRRLASVGLAAGNPVHIEHGHDLPHPEISLRLLFRAAEKLAAIDWLSMRLTIDEKYGCWALPLAAETDVQGRARYPTLTSSRFNAKGELAHRFVMRRMVGDLDNSQHLDHLCRNHACCNPFHLDIVTHATNVRRGRAAYRAVIGQQPLY